MLSILREWVVIGINLVQKETRNIISGYTPQVISEKDIRKNFANMVVIIQRIPKKRNSGGHLNGYVVKSNNKYELTAWRFMLLRMKELRRFGFTYPI